MFNRVILIVLDSVGIGAMPDAADYGDDPGSDTLGNVARAQRLRLPNLARYGLANIKPLDGFKAAAPPEASFGRCALASPGKDTTTGHWEMAGIHLPAPLPLFPCGFPPGLMEEFEGQIGRSCIGNRAASGTEIIAELGAEHVRTGSPIVYTSADSVFQVAAHEAVIPVDELYGICKTARTLLTGPLEVGRVIARPFTGSTGSFQRTANRKDFAIDPPAGMLLDKLAGQGISVHSVGKISDVFLLRGITRSDKTKSNADGMELTLLAMKLTRSGLIFVNLVDFDQQYGHRNDVAGYARALEEADAWIPELEAASAPGDLVILTADHGCDPTTPGTDHSREYVPLLVWNPERREGRDLGLRDTLADIGQTVAENFGVRIAHGTSFLREV